MIPSDRPSLAHIGATLDHLDGKVEVRFTETLTGEDLQRTLDELFEFLHDRAMTTGADVVLDLRAVDYASTALFKGLVRWFKELRESKASYRIHLRVDRSRHWQDMAVATLRPFGGRQLVVEELSPPETA